MYRKFIAFILKRIKKSRDKRVEFLALELIKELGDNYDPQIGVGSVTVFFDYSHIMHRSIEVRSGGYLLRFDTKEKNIHYKKENHE